MSIKESSFPYQQTLFAKHNQYPFLEKEISDGNNLGILRRQIFWSPFNPNIELVCSQINFIQERFFFLFFVHLHFAIAYDQSTLGIQSYLPCPVFVQYLWTVLSWELSHMEFCSFFQYFWTQVSITGGRGYVSAKPKLLSSEKSDAEYIWRVYPGGRGYPRRGGWTKR